MTQYWTLLLTAFMALMSSTNALKLEESSQSVRVDAAIAAKFSRVVYDSQFGPQPYSLYFNGPCRTFTQIGAFQDGETDSWAEIWESKSSFVITFRGTEPKSPANIATDMNGNLVPCSVGNGQCGNVHQGFLNAYLKLQPKLMGFLSNRFSKSSTGNVIITGHSLGASLATLAAYDLANKFPTISYKLINFGSPRVGDSNFKKAFERVASANRVTVERFVNVQSNGGDPFAMITSHFKPYFGGGSSDSSTVDVITQNPSDAQGYVHVIDGSFLGLPQPKDLIGLHSMDTYLEKVLSFLETPQRSSNPGACPSQSPTNAPIQSAETPENNTVARIKNEKSNTTSSPPPPVPSSVAPSIADKPPQDDQQTTESQITQGVQDLQHLINLF